MNKLLTTYRANPTLKNAQKIRAYARKHPFAPCLLLPVDVETMGVAFDHAIKGV
jgi:hypothetical protein